MRTRLRGVLEVLAVILLLPQAFVFLYYFRYFFLGENGLGLLKTLAVYALTVSWVSAPYLVLLCVAVKALLTFKVRWYVTLLICVAAGYGWVAAWNVCVFPVFSYLWSLLPILLCSTGFAGYAGARLLYLESLAPTAPRRAEPERSAEPAKNAGPDLSE